MMLKKLFDFEGSKQRKLAKIILLVGMLVAIVITAFGVKEILDVNHMKTVLDASRLIMGDVALFLLKKYLVWALLILAVALIAFYTLRYLDNKKAA